MNKFETNYALIDPEKISSPKRGIVVEAHPDDLSMFRLTKHLSNKGVGITVVTLTDGAARKIKGFTPNELAAQRWKESQRAVEIVGGAEVFNAGLPDGLLEEYSDDAASFIAQVAERTGAEWIAAPNPEDKHPDHRSAYTAALTVAKNDITIYGMDTIDGLDRYGNTLYPTMHVALPRRTARHEHRSYKANTTQFFGLPRNEQREANAVLAMTNKNGSHVVSLYEAKNTKHNPILKTLRRKID